MKHFKSSLTALKNRKRTETAKHPPVYQRLKTKDTIRLATVSSVKGEQGEELHVSLQHVTLSSDPVYTALSYVWGDATKTKPIVLEGYPVQVTESLEGFLQAAARRWDWQTMSFWIDAICINQQDVTERNRQVRLMKDIYVKSELVRVWLGPTDLGGASAAAISIIKDWIRLLDKHKIDRDDETGGYARIIKHTKARQEVMFKMSEHLGGVEGWRTLANFMNHPWWTRTWTQQESVVHDRVILTCGESSCFVQDARRIAILFAYFKDYDSQVAEAQLRGFAHAIENFLLRLAYEAEKSYDRRLFSILHRIRRYYATDLKDKVYGAYGLANDPWLDTIPVDYNLSVSEVYIAVAAYFLSGQRTLDWISSAPAELENVPSWVPDWSVRRVPRPLTKTKARGFDFKDTFYRAAGDESRVFDANGQREAPGVIKGPEFHVRGIFIDQITEIGVTGVGRPLEAEMEWYSILYEAPEQYHPTGQSKQEAFTRTLTCDTWRYERISESNPTELPVEFVEDEAYIKDPESAETIEDVGFMETLTFLRRFAVTEKGYMGLIPREADVGDWVCLLVGGSVTYILREAPRDEKMATRHLMMGEAYVHGLMDGEGMKLPDTGGIRDIVLI